jgi:hypothetical protein
MTSPAKARVELYAPWQEVQHADFFDALADWSDSAIRRRYETFNDIRLLRGNAPYRYVSRFLPELAYVGVDVSEPAVARARRKYPAAQFSVVEPDLSDIDPATSVCGVLYCKDVVLHQTDPFAFLNRLLRIPSEAAVIRLRTRDKGASVLDPALSCQRHYSGWVPYMVLNVDEVLEAIRATGRAREIVVIRNHMVLGGREGRFLPKDCYEPSTGTSETALFVRIGVGGGNAPVVTIHDRKEAAPGYTPWQRIRRQIRLRVPGGRAVFAN